MGSGLIKDLALKSFNHINDFKLAKINHLGNFIILPENLTIEEALQYHFEGVGLKSKSCIVVIPKPEVLHSANSISADTLLEYFTVKYSENELLKKRTHH